MFSISSNTSLTWRATASGRFKTSSGSQFRFNQKLSPWLITELSYELLSAGEHQSIPGEHQEIKGVHQEIAGEHQEIAGGHEEITGEHHEANKR